VASITKSTQWSEAGLRWQWLLPAGLFLLALLVYANTFQHGMMYSWDDNRYLRENMLLRDPSPGAIVQIFSQFYFAAYIPVTLLTYWIEYNIWGLEPSGYHVVNVVLHALNSALVYLFLARLLKNRAVAALAAVLFVIHPLQVESVAWISERKNLLSMLFTLLAFLSHIRSAEPDGGRRWLALTWFLYLLAALSKPTVVGIPLLFMAYDYLWAGLPLRDVIRRNVVPLAIAAAAAVLIIVAHAEAGGIKEYRGNSPVVTAGIMLMVYWDYVVSLVAPFNLNNFYLYDVSMLNQHQLSVVLGALLVIGSVVFAWKQPLGRPFSLFAVLWIWLLMLPVSNIVPIAIERADRYIYFPGVAIFALVGLAVERLWYARTTPTWRYGVTAAVAVAIGGLSMLTIQRNQVWTTEGTLWIDHLQDYPDSQTGWLNLGVYYYNELAFEQAKESFEQLLRRNPNHFKGNRFMGHIAIRTGNYADAIPYYERAAQVDPTDPITQNYLGLAYFRTGNYASALEAYRRTIELDQSYDEAYLNLGISALQTGNNSLAAEALAIATERQPENALALSEYCAALTNLDRMDEAIEYCAAAARLEPTNGLFVGRYAHLLLLQDRAQEALPVAEQAVSVAPELSLSYRVLGDALASLEREEEAISAYRQALELDPTNRRAQAGLQALTGD